MGNRERTNNFFLNFEQCAVTHDVDQESIEKSVSLPMESVKLPMMESAETLLPMEKKLLVEKKLEPNYFHIVDKKVPAKNDNFKPPPMDDAQ